MILSTYPEYLKGTHAVSEEKAESPPASRPFAREAVVPASLQREGRCPALSPDICKPRVARVERAD